MKRIVIGLLSLLVVGVGLGGLVVVSGIVPVKASSGHLPPTRWLLNFASQRSVSTHAMGIEVPSLDEPGLVQLGAAAYQSNCQWCHGAPTHPRPVVMSHATPEPPYLPEVIPLWEPQELFYLVKHGVKFTGMPAWPTQTRDDEVWAVVAFLLELPSMKPERYRELLGEQLDNLQIEKSVSGNQLASERCAICHGEDGQSTVSPRVPKLSGQKLAYLKETLLAYASGDRNSGIMQPIAARLSAAELTSLAEFYAQQPGGLSDTPTISAESEPDEQDVSSVSAGGPSARKLVLHGDQQAKIPSCSDCHGPTAEDSHAAYPRLAGQHATFIQTQLRLFAGQQRGGGKQAKIMHPIASKLTDTQQKQIADFYQQLSD